jgi:hypothetical protein
MSTSQSVDNIPNGPGAAAILGAGIGCAALGLLTLASEVSSSIGAWLNFYGPVGPLSGKTMLTVLVWLVAWFILSRLWGKKVVALGPVNTAAFALLGVGFLLTFPPVWGLLGAG